MNRRRFIRSASGLLLAMAHPASARDRRSDPRTLTLFLGGDVMTGRGVDQALPHPSDPRLYEQSVRDARDYLRLAEAANGPIPRPIDFAHIWGDGLEILDQMDPDLRIVNLETAVTRHDKPWPRKGIHYRMHPANTPCLTSAGIDLCVLANNHALDWSRPGLDETLDSLHAAGILTAGAGRDLQEASAPAALLARGQRRVLVYSMATSDSGIMPGMNATPDRSGLRVLPRLTPDHTDPMVEQIRAERQPGDIVVASIHWGGNWDYVTDMGQRKFARDLVRAGVDVIHGHSSHHAKGIEVIDDRPVIYGCGDLINDYEGIRDGRQEYRPDLKLMYFVTLDATSGALERLTLFPMHTRRLRLEHASPEDASWLRDTLAREGAKLGTTVELARGGALRLGWSDGEAG